MKLGISICCVSEQHGFADPKLCRSLTQQTEISSFCWVWSQASLPITKSRSLLKLMSIESVIPSNHLILCHPLLLLSSIFPSISIFSNESAFHIRWLQYRIFSFSFSISPSNGYLGLIFFRIDWFDLLSLKYAKEENNILNNVQIELWTGPVSKILRHIQGTEVRLVWLNYKEWGGEWLEAWSVRSSLEILSFSVVYPYTQKNE